jgi:hypothetical protein
MDFSDMDWRHLLAAVVAVVLVFAFFYSRSRAGKPDASGAAEPYEGGADGAGEIAQLAIELSG